MQSETQRHPATRPAGLSRTRATLALILLLVVGSVCFSLGMWQLGRAQERDALHQLIERGRQQAPMALTPSSQPADLLPWRAATAQGHWSSEHTVLLQNRNLDGRPGYWVATPLLLDTAAAGGAQSEQSAEAVLVLRGWMPRDMQAAGVTPAIPQEPGLVRVQGELHAHVPRIFELWDWAGGQSSQLPQTLPQADDSVAQVQNLNLQAYAQATGLRLLPVVLAQTVGSHADSTTELRREWPGPSLDSDQNRGYALQWFSFCAIALIAAAFVIRSMLRRRSGNSSKDVS